MEEIVGQIEKKFTEYKDLLTTTSGPKTPVQFENEWYNYTSDWMLEHYIIPFFLSFVYLVTIFSIQKIMKDKKPFALRNALCGWNLFLALFSITGVFTIGYKVYENVYINGVGWSNNMCDVIVESNNPWGFIFAISKIAEFVDTLFIVLRKSNLIFLHWYHHIATMLYCWFGWAQKSENADVFALMNLMVHSIMYLYYAATATGRRYGPKTRQTITTLQLLQMFFGIAFCVHNMTYCNNHPILSTLALLMYGSYAFLFAKLYYQSYLAAKANKQK